MGRTATTTATRRTTTTRNHNNSSDGGSGGEGGEVCIYFFFILIVVVFPLEMLLLSNGYTFTPWFFIFFFSCIRRSSTTASGLNGDSGGGGSSTNNTGDTFTSTPSRRVHRHDRVLLPTTDEDEGEQSSPVPSIDDDNCFWKFDEEDATPGKGNKSFVDGNSATCALVDETTTKENADGSNQANKPIEPKEFSLLGPSSGRRVPKKKDTTPNKVGITFRNAVDQSHFRTTDVDAKSLSKQNHLIKEDPIDGTYEVEYELVMNPTSKSAMNTTVVVKNTIDMKFLSGFCGWYIMGTRPAPSLTDNHGFGILTGNGEFHVQRGFLAKTGNIYWEDRGAFFPSFNVLVGGKIASNSSFDGHWLSSSTSEDGKLYTGRVTKFARLCTEDEEDEVQVAGDIV